MLYSSIYVCVCERCERWCSLYVCRFRVKCLVTISLVTISPGKHAMAFRWVTLIVDDRRRVLVSSMILPPLPCTVQVIPGLLLYGLHTAYAIIPFRLYCYTFLLLYPSVQYIYGIIVIFTAVTDEVARLR